MNNPITPFVGTWILDVEASDYQQSEPPQGGSLKIEADGLRMRFAMHTIDAKGEATDVTFSGVPDGGGSQLSQSGLADALVHYLRDDGALVSEARRGGAALMSAVRKVACDGGAMSVTQTVFLPDDTTVVDTTIYRRAQ